MKTDRQAWEAIRDFPITGGESTADSLVEALAALERSRRSPPPNSKARIGAQRAAGAGRTVPNATAPNARRAGSRPTGGCSKERALGRTGCMPFPEIACIKQLPANGIKHKTRALSSLS